MVWIFLFLCSTVEEILLALECWSKTHVNVTLKYVRLAAVSVFYNQQAFHQYAAKDVIETTVTAVVNQLLLSFVSIL